MVDTVKIKESEASWFSEEARDCAGVVGKGNPEVNFVFQLRPIAGSFVQ